VTTAAATAPTGLRPSGDIVVGKNRLSLRPMQGMIFNDRRRFRVVLAGRRGGKTERSPGILTRVLFPNVG